MTMSKNNLNSDHYSQSPADFTKGFARVGRVRPTRMMSEAQQRAIAVHESRVASASEFLADLLKGDIRSYYLQEMLRPSTPEMARQLNEAYPGLVRPMTVQESAAVGAMFGADLAESMTTSDFPLLVGGTRAPHT